LPVWLRRWLLRAAYRGLVVYRKVMRPHTRGVKCLICRGDEVLLVRHTYGDRERWELPGGGCKRREQPLDAARREISEELGVVIDDWRYLGVLAQREHGPSGRAFCFAGRGEGLDLEIDGGEIAQARWFARDELLDPSRPAGGEVRAVLERSQATATGDGANGAVSRRSGDGG